MEKNILDGMQLPFNNSNEDLETISRNLVKQLFDVALFEIRDEISRDKGIDFTIELKHNSKYTNFRFNVQLKATESITPNSDNSYSLSLSTSNIQYLLNSGNPAYYILYIKPINKFYYEDLNSFLRTISINTDWDKQGSHTLRFSKELNREAINEIYNNVLKHGESQRKISEKLIYMSASIDTGDSVIIDVDLNVTDDREIRNIIENIGFDLINKGEWNKIIALHKRASGNVDITAKYNLVLGIAYYHSAYAFDALSHFKKALNLKHELTQDLVEHLRYFDAVTKLSLGIINEDEYNKIINELEKADNIEFYIKIEKAKEKYLSSIESLSKDFNSFKNDLLDIINSNTAQENVKLLARCELLYYEGSKNNMDYFNAVSEINILETAIGFAKDLRIKSAANSTKIKLDWNKKAELLIQDAINSKNYFVYFIARLYRIKVVYEFTVYTNGLALMQNLPNNNIPGISDNVAKWINEVDMIYEYYWRIGHIQNACAALATKYELQHFIGDFENAKYTLENLTKMADKYDMIAHKMNIEFLKNGGTSHERMNDLVNDIKAELAKEFEEYNILIDKMQKMDMEEFEFLTKVLSGYNIIELYPIGHFSFPSDKRSEVYKILNIQSENVKKNFDAIFEIAIPVANIHHNPIPQEGYIDTNQKMNGIETFRNFYRVRKAFFENKFYRHELQF